MKRRTLLLGVLALLCVVLVAWFFVHIARTPGGAEKNYAGVEKASPADSYPDPALTPGAVFPNVTEKEVCRPGYASGARRVSSKEKREVFRRYGKEKPKDPQSYEVDHFISLGLGGSNDIANLWPEPAGPKPGFREKDRVENYLHSEVCAGRITLKEAQERIKEDWYKVYLEIQKKK